MDSNAPMKSARESGVYGRKRGGDYSAERTIHETPEEPNLRDNVLMQCIVSGILVVVVLAVSVLNFAPAVAARDGLRTALSGANSVQELVRWVRGGDADDTDAIHENGGDGGADSWQNGLGGLEHIWGPSPETEPESFPEFQLNIPPLTYAPAPFGEPPASSPITMPSGYVENYLEFPPLERGDAFYPQITEQVYASESWD